MSSHGRFQNPAEAALTGIKDHFGRQELEAELIDSSAGAKLWERGIALRTEVGAWPVRAPHE